MRLPDTIKIEYEELDEAEWFQIKQHTEKALQELINFREQEGIALENDIHNSIDQITSLSKKVEPFEQERIDKVKERILDNFKELDANGNFDKKQI